MPHIVTPFLPIKVSNLRQEIQRVRGVQQVTGGDVALDIAGALERPGRPAAGAVRLGSGAGPTRRPPCRAVIILFGGARPGLAAVVVVPRIRRAGGALMVHVLVFSEVRRRGSADVTSSRSRVIGYRAGDGVRVLLLLLLLLVVREDDIVTLW